MCDTLMLLMPGETWLAKNSDREPDEPQRVEWRQAGQHAGGTRQATYLSVAAPGHSYATWISRPDWMWGAEMGVNEKGVAIGNEAVFTRLVNRKESGLLGMDLLRLALEQAASADEALEVIVGYLERYGQGGAGGFRDKKFFYDNSFLIADSRLGWQLETAGRLWVARKYSTENGRLTAAISNALSIRSDFDLSSTDIEDRCIRDGHWNGKGNFDFAAIFSTRFMPWAARANDRRRCNLGRLADVRTDQAVAGQLAETLQQHKNGGSHSSNADVCMHATGIFRPSQTTQSMIANLSPSSQKVWMTGGSAACVSLFKPLFRPGQDGVDNTWLTDQAGFWERWQNIYLATEKSKDLRDRVRSLNTDYQSGLWHADAESANRLLTDWWQAISRIALPLCP